MSRLAFSGSICQPLHQVILEPQFWSQFSSLDGTRMFSLPLDPAWCMTFLLNGVEIQYHFLEVIN